MKRISLFAFAVVILASCKKIQTTPEPSPMQGDPVTTRVLTSIHFKDTTQHRLIIDSFEFDAKGRISRFLQLIRDSAQLRTISPDAGDRFYYNGSDTLPMYIVRDKKDTAWLAFQNGMLVKDSTTSESWWEFKYGNQQITATLHLPSSVGNFLDTLNFQNNNVASINNVLMLPNHPDYESRQFSYSSYINPTYNFKNMGMVLFVEAGDEMDFVSQNLSVSSSLKGQEYESTAWQTSGQTVISGVESELNYPNYSILITFNYRDK